MPIADYVGYLAMAEAAMAESVKAAVPALRGAGATLCATE